MVGFGNRMGEKTDDINRGKNPLCFSFNAYLFMYAELQHILVFDGKVDFHTLIMSTRAFSLTFGCWI
jgi:hypothetical protein